MITLRYGWGADGRIEDHMVQRGYADVAAARAAVSEVPADLARARARAHLRARRAGGRGLVAAGRRRADGGAAAARRMIR